MEDEKKRKFLEALGNIVEKNKRDNMVGSVVPDLKSKNISKGTLDKEILTAKGSDLGRDLTPSRTLVKGGTPHIDTKQIAKKTDIRDFTKRVSDLDLKHRLKSSFKAAAEAGDDELMHKLKKIAMKVGKGATTGLKVLPIVGAAAGLIGADDASAAIPGLDSSESVGMSSADENQMLAERQAQVDYIKSQAAKDKEERMKMLSKLVNKGS